MHSDGKKRLGQCDLSSVGVVVVCLTVRAPRLKPGLGASVDGRHPVGIERSLEPSERSKHLQLALVPCMSEDALTRKRRSKASLL